MVLELVTFGGIIATGMEIKKSEELSERTKVRWEQAIQKENDAYRKLKVEEGNAEKSLIKLYNTKKGIVLTSLKEIKEIFEPISSLPFLASFQIAEKFNTVQLSQCIHDIDTSISVYCKPLTNRQMMVSVLFGAVGIMYADLKQQEKENAYAQQQLRLAGVYEQNVENKIIVLQGIMSENEKLRSLLQKINIYLREGLKSSAKIIERLGDNEELYNDDEVFILKTTIQFADLIEKLCMSKLYNENSKLDENTKQLIERSNKILKDANEKVNIVLRGVRK